MAIKPSTVILYTIKIILVLLAIIGLSGLIIVWDVGETPKKEITIKGLNGEVQVYRDARGVPHIIAKDINDLFFVQGYMYANDRGWQLELVRRIINGELSELAPTFGSDSSVMEKFYETDLFLKQIGLKRAAEKIYGFLSPQLKSYLQSYVDGVNYYIRTHPEKQPLELELLNLLNDMSLKIHEWSVIDTLAIQGYMGLALSLHGATTDILRRDFSLKIGKENTNLLMPIYYKPARDWFLSLNRTDFLPPSYTNKQFSRNLESYVSEKILPEPLLQLLGNPFGHGSNNWVVGPMKSAYGYAMLANDMHLDLTTPGIWYEVHLSAPGFHVWGWALPGAPMVVAGHNEFVQWGFTNTMADVSDLYYLKQTDDGTGYYVGNKIKPFEIIKDSIYLGNGTVIPVNIKVSEFGPMVTFGNMTYAFQWPMNYAVPENNIFQALYYMNIAKNAVEFRNALRTFSMPGQNVVFADVYGNFGYQYTGLIPIRSKGYGLIPHDGSSGEYNWTGFIPFEELYHEINPKKGYFATANQYLVPSNYTYYLSASYAPPYRAQRISQLLEEKQKLTIDDIKKIQQDTYFLPVQTFQQLLLNIDRTNLTDNEKAVLDAATSWNGYVDKNSSKAPAFFAWLAYFSYETFMDNFGYDLFYSEVQWNFFFMLDEMLNISYNHPLFDNTNTTTKVENAVDIARIALKKGTNFLVKELGSNPSLWSWGSLHKAQFAHFLGAAFGFLNPPLVDADGAMYTVKVGNSPFWTNEEGIEKLDFTQTMGSSERLVSLVKKGFNNVYVITPPGEIGILNSGHYDDQIDAWAKSDYYTTVFDINYVISHYTLQTTFKPA